MNMFLLIGSVFFLVTQTRAITLDRPDVNNCTMMWFEQDIDHFNWSSREFFQFLMHVRRNALPLGKRTFLQRYFVYNQTYKRGGPIFFYAGSYCSQSPSVE